MTGEHLIAFAGKILLLHREPAGCRAAISRSYYGAFHLASAFLREVGLSVEYNHGHLQHDFYHSGNSTANAIGQHLEVLSSQRVDADYRLDSRGVEEHDTCALAVERSRQVEHLLQQLRDELQPPHAKNAFVESIQSHRRRVGRRQ